MILLLTALLGQGCHVQVAHNSYVAPVASYSHQSYVGQAYTPTYYPTYTYATDQYFSNSILAYRVSDPEKESLFRTTEIQANALKGSQEALRGATDALVAVTASIKAGTPSPGQGGPTPITDGPPKPAQQAAPGGASATDGKAVLQQTCGKCHAGGKSSGGFQIELATINGETATSRRQREIAHYTVIADVIQAGEMPPKAERQLTEDQKQAIAKLVSVDRQELKQLAKGAVASK